MKRLVCILVGLYAALLFASFGLAGPDGKTLVQDQCGACHSPSRICAALGERDQSAWAATVARMASYGAALNAAQQEAVAGYLAGLAPGSASFCK